jgi:hypothetical protein
MLREGGRLGVRRIWTVRISMREEEDEERRELVFVKRMVDIDGPTKLVHTIIHDAATEAVHEILKAHRVLTVGEE